MARKNFSKKREAIFQSIYNTNCHPSAEWVYNDLKGKYPDLSLGTVYRNMNLFKDMGLIISVGTVKGQERFDARTNPHSHFICDKCGSVIDIDFIEYNHNFTEKAASDYGYKIDRQLVFFYGTCKKCLEDDGT